jgi:hypothetical protein
VKQIHVCQDIEGALLNWKDRDYPRNLSRDDGRPMTAAEGRAFLVQCLREGKNVLPFGPPCEGFSYQTGCPGHEVPDVPDERAPLTKEQLFNRFGSKDE